MNKHPFTVGKSYSAETRAHSFPCFRSCVFVLLLCCSGVLRTQELIDTFESLAGWTVSAQGDAVVQPSLVQSETGRCLKLEFDFGPAAGYAGVEKAVELPLPQNFAFSFRIRGDALNDGFQLRLYNELEAAAWWWTKKDFSVPASWTRVVVKKRQFRQAWGDKPENEPHGITKIGFFLLPRGGGKGVLYIDELTLSEIPVPETGVPVPVIFASSALKGSEAGKAMDRNLGTLWRSEGKQSQEHLFMDLRGVYDFGGIKIAWDSAQWAKEFSVSVSDDGKFWQEHYTVRNGNGIVSFVPLPEGEGRYIKINMKSSAAKKGYAVKEIAILGNSFSASANATYEEISRTFPRGLFPAYFIQGEKNKSLFTLTGAGHTVYFSEDGAVQPAGLPFLLEPFVTENGKFLNRAAPHGKPSNAPAGTAHDDSMLNAITEAATLDYDGFQLTTTPRIKQAQGISYLYLEYAAKNTGKTPRANNLYIAIRPFSVTLDSSRKSQQGALQLTSLSYDETCVLVNEISAVYPAEKPSAFGAAEFDQGDIALFCRVDSLPAAKQAVDHMNLASGAFLYALNLAPRETKIISFIIPFTGVLNPLQETPQIAPQEK